MSVLSRFVLAILVFSWCLVSSQSAVCEEELMEDRVESDLAPQWETTLEGN